MKRFFFLLMSLMLMTGTTFAVPVQIIFGVGIEDNTPIIPGNSRGPIDSLVVWQDSYQLEFQDTHQEFTLCLIDESDAIVYQALVPSTQTTVILPSWLSGEYELRLYPTGSNLYFYGWIEL